MRVKETEASFSLDVVMLDALIGILALASIIVIALLLGGFSFFTPWLIICPPIIFVAGFVRSRSEGSIWLKCLFICLVPLAFTALLAKPSGEAIGIAAPLLTLPCASGIWLRRRLSGGPR
jgi:hypothetical protein